MKCLNGDKARHLRLRAVVAYPALTIALAVSVALALTPFAPSQVMALVASPAAIETPTPTSTASSTTTSSPTSPVAPTAAPVPAPAATPSPTAGVAASPSLPTFAAAGDHHVVARIEGSQMQANYLPVDEPVLDALPHQRFRVRFRLQNAGTAATTKTPRLEYRTEGVGTFLVVPEQPELGVPMHAAQEWIPSLDLLGGTMLCPRGADIAVADLRMNPGGTFTVNGHRSMGANPDQPITLPSDSYTEQEFTLELTIDAKYLTAYELRITSGGTPLTGADVATIRLGEPPAVQLSPGQRQGVAVVDPKPTSKAGVAK